MGKLDGKVALISGGARGQGAAEAQLFAREGAKVVFGDVLDAEGKKVEAAIRAEGRDASYVHLDVISEADWQNAIKLAIPEMRRAGGGSIVNISSVAGIGQSLHQEPAYAASKGAIRIFTKVTASQHARDKIRCNSVHPGPIDTEMLHSALPDPEVLRRRMERVPLGRMGTIDDVVRLVLYLASDESSYMTGSELVINGGALEQ